MFGDVIRVKILFKNKSKALIQFRDAEQAATALKYLNGVQLFGKPLKIMPSNVSEVQMPTKDNVVCGALAAALLLCCSLHMGVCVFLWSGVFLENCER